MPEPLPPLDWPKVTVAQLELIQNDIRARVPLAVTAARPELRRWGKRRILTALVELARPCGMRHRYRQGRGFPLGIVPIGYHKLPDLYGMPAMYVDELLRHPRTWLELKNTLEWRRYQAADLNRAEPENYRGLQR